MHLIPLSESGLLHSFIRWPSRLLLGLLLGSVLYYGSKSINIAWKRWNLRRIRDAAAETTKKLPKIDTGHLTKMGKGAILAAVFVAGFIAGQIYSSHQIRKTYQQQYAAWQGMKVDYERNYAAWLARQNFKRENSK